jgi:hypothetical protein
MNNMKISREIRVVLSAAVASVATGLLVQQQYHQAFAFNNQQNAQSDLIIPGSNANDEPATTL